MNRYQSPKIRVSISLCLLLVFTGIPSSYFSQTKTQPSQKELQNKKNKLNDDIKQLNNQLSQTKASKKSQINTIVVINTKIKVREELISTINNELARINSSIKKNVAEVNSLKASLDKLKSEYAKMIYFAQRNQDSYNKIMFLFSAGDFNQAYMRIKYFQQYAAFRKKQANEIIATQQILSGKLKELEAQRHEKNVLLGNEKEEKVQLDSEKQQQEIVLSELQQQEKELKEELEKKKKDAENLQIAIKKLIEAEIISIEASQQSKTHVKEVYPNPTNETINCELFSPRNAEVLVEILDFTGNLVGKNALQVQAGKNILTTDMSSLKNGIYLLKVTLEKDNFQSVTKVIKN